MMTTLRATPDVASSAFVQSLHQRFTFPEARRARRNIPPWCRATVESEDGRAGPSGRQERGHRWQVHRARPSPGPPVQRPPARAPGTRLRAPERRMKFAPACAILLPFSLLRLRLQPGYPLFEFGCVENPREGIEKAPEFGCFAWGQLAIGHRLHQRRSGKLRIRRGAQLGQGEGYRPLLPRRADAVEAKGAERPDRRPLRAQWPC